MKHRILFFVLSFLAHPALGQVYIQPEISYATFSFGDLKNLQKDLITTSGISLQPVTVFPGFIGFGLRVGNSLG